MNHPNPCASSRGLLLLAISSAQLLATGLFAIEGDNNHVLVMEEFETEEQAREFLGSEYLREAMGRAGVNDEPDIQVVEVLEEGSA